MLDFNEDLLQFIWQHRLLKPLPISTYSGKVIRVIDPGQLNRHSGPDFSNGKIEIEGTLLAGDIEIHKKSSDWIRHGHTSDAAYDRIILHVVYEHDLSIPQNTKHQVEILELKSLIAKETFDQYRSLISGFGKLPCARLLKDAEDLQFLNWVDRMTVERLEVRVERIQALTTSFNGDLTQTFYTLLVRNLGYHVNAVPFEILARSLPLHLLLKHNDQLLQVEALVFGCAGFLDTPLKDPYLRKLQNEFSFLARKYKLIPMRKEVFKNSGMRPANSAAFRLAQLCQLIHQRPALFLAPHQFTNYAEIHEGLAIELSGYWSEHYHTDGSIVGRILKPGKQSMENLMINTFAPFLFYYGRRFAKEEYCAQAITLLENCEEEDNLKTRLFSAKKASIRSAIQSQGLLQLHDTLCTKRACLRCGIGSHLLKTKKTIVV